MRAPDRIYLRVPGRTDEEARAAGAAAAAKAQAAAERADAGSDGAGSDGVGSDGAGTGKATKPEKAAASGRAGQRDNT